MLLSVPDVLRRQQLSDRVLELAQKASGCRSDRSVGSGWHNPTLALQVALVMYFLVDHIGWLKQACGFLKPSQKANRNFRGKPT